MTAAAVSLTRRPARPEDEPFLRGLFVSGRPELDLLPRLGPAGEALIDQQVAAQRAQYLTGSPHAHDEILMVEDRQVGRCWTALDRDELRVLDLAVHPSHRRRGIARATLQRLCRRAADRGLVVRLHVWHDNVAARALYDGAGFQAVAEQGGRVLMEWGGARGGVQEAS